MKKFTIQFGALLLAMVLVWSCNKDADITTNAKTTDDIPTEVLLRLTDLGFDVSDITMDGEDYIVEKCIRITPETLKEMEPPTTIEGPNGEQYHTFNLVTGTPRTIVVKGKRLNGVYSQALDAAIAQYNSLNMNLTFTRDDRTRNFDIEVKTRRGSAGGVAGFPTSGGDPYNRVTVYTGTGAYGLAVVTHVMIHELGHCIGMRHADWFDRSYSCGSGGSEGQQNNGVGAVHIPGTTSSYSPNSVMNSCFHTGSNGNFNNDDVTAFETVY